MCGPYTKNYLIGMMKNGPAVDIKTEITSMDIMGTIATVRLESDNWTGHKFTDFLHST
ncbi:MAG: nuclear transport factor 2 family protein [Gammaproteobacteria bacterium]